jgi:hypothetical protein
MGNRYDFNNLSEQLPEYLILDTSVVLCTVIKKQGDKIYEETKQFLYRLQQAIDAGKCNASLPPHAINEALNRLTGYFIQGSLPLGFAAKDEHKRRPELINQLDIPNKLFNFLKAMDALGIEIVQPQEVKPLENDPNLSFESHIVFNIDDYQLFAGDANIVVAAERLDIFDIASVDKDFIRVSNNSDFNIYTAASLRNHS